MDRAKRFPGRFGDLLPRHPVKISQFNDLSLYIGQGCQRSTYLSIRKYRLRLLRDVHIGIRRFVQERIAILPGAHQRLRTYIAPAVGIDGKIARDPKEPARERSQLRLIRPGALPDAPKGLLEDVLRQRLIANDLQR